MVIVCCNLQRLIILALYFSINTSTATGVYIRRSIVLCVRHSHMYTYVLHCKHSVRCLAQQVIQLSVRPSVCHTRFVTKPNNALRIFRYHTCSIRRAVSLTCIAELLVILTKIILFEVLSINSFLDVGGDFDECGSSSD